MICWIARAQELIFEVELVDAADGDLPARLLEPLDAKRGASHAATADRRLRSV